MISFCYQLDFEYPPLPKLNINTNQEETKGFDHHDITKAHMELISNHHYEDALMLHLMYALKAMPFELRWIRFEDFYQSKGKCIINFRHTKAAKLKRVILAKSLYQEVENYRKSIQSNKSMYMKGQRMLTKKLKLKGHFVFKNSSETMINKLKTGFNSKVPWFS